MEIIGHRGASFDAPENTLAAVRLAWQQRADAVEVDVHLSHDGKIVVIHDPNTRKLAGVNRKVARQSLAELRALDVGRRRGAAWAGERIPTLEEVLAMVPRNRRLFIEIKCGPEIAPELERVLQGTGCRPEQVVFIGFSLPTMRFLKQDFPEIEAGWITVLRRHWRTRRWPKPELLIEKVQATGLNAVDLNFRGPINAEFVEKFHSSGLKVYVWTVDSVAKAKKLTAAGVDGITTNRPGWLREQLDR
ncbi:MAG: ugpQ [Pedosphaera sp.]|nr:ugpQ [Pedosphaera sp.]